MSDSFEKRWLEFFGEDLEGLSSNTERLSLLYFLVELTAQQVEEIEEVDVTKFFKNSRNIQRIVLDAYDIPIEQKLKHISQLADKLYEETD